MSSYTEKTSWQVWDHKTPLYSRTLEKYFDNINEIDEYFADTWQVGEQVKEDFDSVRDSYPQLCNYLELYICTPVYFPEFELPDFLHEEIPDGYDDIYDAIPQDHPIIVKLNKLNQFIAKQKYILWYEDSNIKPIPESLAEGYQPVVSMQPRCRKQHSL